MHARSALFDLFGDHLRTRNDRAPVAALVRMLGPLGVAAPAVRTAISRMVRQGWLTPVQLDEGRGYQLTDRARRRLDDAAARIYGTRGSGWKGSWDVLVLEPVPHRAGRERIRSGLSFLGYAQLTDSTWIGPYASPEVAAMLENEDAVCTRFEGYDGDPTALARRAWDLDALGRAYAAWHQDARALVTSPQPVAPEAATSQRPAHEGAAPHSAAVSSHHDDDIQAFVVRSMLVHEWRKFLFSDPGLPAELLPPDWPGIAAARFFAREAERLLPAASRFVDRCLDPDQSGARP